MMMSASFSRQLLISTVLVLLVPLYVYFRRSSSSIRSKNPSVLPRNWPIIYMFPSFMANVHKLHDYLAVVLAGSDHNFRAHSPPGMGIRFFITCDPENARHIFTTNYTNFPKGAEFAAIFDIMGGALFTMDGEPCRRPRANLQRVLSSPRMVSRLAACCRDKVENGLLPLLAHMESTCTPIEVQELTSRLMFDLTSTMVFGVDSSLLSSDLPPMDAPAAMDTVMEVGFFRHVVPAACWKAMRRLNIGPERKLGKAHVVLRRFVAEMIQRRKTKGKHVGRNDEEQESSVEDILSSLINDPDYADDNLLCATLISYMLAGRDTVGTTLPWIFYNLAQNPDVVSNIRNELSPIIASRKVVIEGADAMGSMVIFEPEETKPLLYLKAVLYETLRLYPPAAIERKTVKTDDIMPSGHEVKAGDTILIAVHSMGRMEGLWGKDCLDYNPHRWLLQDGKKLRYVPSHKFLAFNSGPRMCPGKEIAVMQMKTIVAALVWNFDMELVEGHRIQPKMSCILQMKNGFMVNLKKREI
uniref:Uncharacterized protein n=1 Tax=Avena sativa TaxID=4498 RepID=A0ACD5ZAJ2_AVESA